LYVLFKPKSMLSNSGHGEIAMKDFLQTATANLWRMAARWRFMREIVAKNGGH